MKQYIYLLLAGVVLGSHCSVMSSDETSEGTSEAEDAPTCLEDLEDSASYAVAHGGSKSVGVSAGGVSGVSAGGVSGVSTGGFGGMSHGVFGSNGIFGG
jgi:hypothetical protein